MRTKILAAAAAVAVSTLLSACGGTGSTPPAASSVQGSSRSAVSSSFNYSVHPRASAVADLFLSNCTTQCVSPTTIKSGYNFPSNATGAGKADHDRGRVRQPDDYERCQPVCGGQRPPPLTLGSNFSILYPGGKPTFNANQASDVSWAEETTLDVEWAHASAPGATIKLIVAPNDQGQSIQTAQQYAIETVKGDVRR